MSRHADFNGLQLLVAQQALAAINEARKVLHSIQDGFKVKMDSRFPPFDCFCLDNKRLSKRMNRLFFFWAGEAEAGSGGDRPAKE
jgi:hypothetical protein